MDVTPLIKSGHLVIESYSDDGIVINGETYTQSFCLYPDKLQRLDVGSLQDLEADILPKIEADVILFAVTDNLSSDDVMRLKMSDYNIDVMDIGSACRTYNVLLAEGRRVVLVKI